MSKNCCICKKPVVWSDSLEIINEESPPDQYDRPMESYTEYEQIFRLGETCADCYQKQKEDQNF